MLFRIRRKKRGNSRVICVLGMHRSGTSLLSALLGMCGVYIGESDEMYPPGKGNPKGHWEHMVAKKINEDILGKFKGSGDNPPYLPPNWYRSRDMAPVKKRARMFIRDMESKSAIWAWKDPRTTLTVEFWKEIVDTINYVIMLRDPLAVAMSLQKRDGLQIQDGLKLCAIYWLSILHHTKGEKRIFVKYDDLVNKGKEELSRVVNFIDNSMVSIESSLHEIEDFIDMKLNHNPRSDSAFANLNVTNETDVERYIVVECQKIIGKKCKMP